MRKVKSDKIECLKETPDNFGSTWWSPGITYRGGTHIRVQSELELEGSVEDAIAILCAARQNLVDSKIEYNNHYGEYSSVILHGWRLMTDEELEEYQRRKQALWDYNAKQKADARASKLKQLERLKKELGVE